MIFIDQLSINNKSNDENSIQKELDNCTINLIDKAKELNEKRKIFKTHRIDIFDGEVWKAVVNVQSENEVKPDNLEIPLDSNLLKYKSNFIKRRNKLNINNSNKMERNSFHNDKSLNVKNSDMLINTSNNDDFIQNQILTPNNNMTNSGNMTPYQKHLISKELKRKQLKIKANGINGFNMMYNRNSNVITHSIKVKNVFNKSDILNEATKSNEIHKNLENHKIKIEQNSRPTVVRNSVKLKLPHDFFQVFSKENTNHKHFSKIENFTNRSDFQTLSYANVKRNSERISKTFKIRNDITKILKILDTKSNVVSINTNDNFKFSDINFNSSNKNNPNANINNTPLITLGNEERNSNRHSSNGNKYKSKKYIMKSDKLTLPFIQIDQQKQQCVSNTSKSRRNSNFHINKFKYSNK